VICLELCSIALDKRGWLLLHAGQATERAPMRDPLVATAIRGRALHTRAVIGDLKEQREAVRLQRALLAYAPDSDQAHHMREIARKLT
jgi:MinD-like ATPase involved in chromosome partitioning or flagellar assembly